MKLLFSAALAVAFTVPASFAYSARVDWVNGSVQYQQGGNWVNVTQGMSIPDNAVVRATGSARVKVTLGDGRSAIIAGRQVAVSEAASGGLGGRFGSGSASTRVSNVAGVRANNGAENANPFTNLQMDSSVPHEAEALNTARATWETDQNAAVDGLAEFVAANPMAYRASYELAVSYTRLGNFAAAEPLFATVIDEIPAGVDMPTAYWNYMICLQEQGKFEDSNRVAQTAINRYPSHGNLGRWYLVVANNQFKLGDAEAARTAVDRATSVAMERVRVLVRDLTSKADEGASLNSLLNSDASADAVLGEQEMILEARAALMGAINSMN